MMRKWLNGLIDLILTKTPLPFHCDPFSPDDVLPSIVAPFAARQSSFAKPMWPCVAERRQMMMSPWRTLYSPVRTLLAGMLPRRTNALDQALLVVGALTRP